MNAKQLIEAATYFNDRPSCECDPESGITNCLGCDIGMMATYILSAVRPDDDEPVTRESCLAMGARIFGPRRYGFEVSAGLAIVVDMTEPDVVESEVYIMDDEHRVTLKWNPTNRDLRRLVAALGE